MRSTAVAWSSGGDRRRGWRDDERRLDSTSARECDAGGREREPSEFQTPWAARSYRTTVPQLKGASVAVGTETVAPVSSMLRGRRGLSMTTLSVGSFEFGNSPAGGVGTSGRVDGGSCRSAKTLALTTSLRGPEPGGDLLRRNLPERWRARIGGTRSASPPTRCRSTPSACSAATAYRGRQRLQCDDLEGRRLEAKDGLLVISGAVNGAAPSHRQRRNR